MSKIIDALGKFGAETREGRLQPDPRAREARRTPYEMTQEELGDVYFARSAAAKQLPPPTLIRVVEGRRTYFLPWAITTLALAFATAALFTSKRLSVEIRVVDDAASLESAATAPAKPNASRATGAAIPVPVSDFALSAGAGPPARASRGELVISNRAPAGPVYAAAVFRPPFDASRRVLEFEAMGEAGHETVEVILKDARSQTNLNVAPIRPFPRGLATRWQKARVTVERGEFFDAARIVQLRFEAGADRTGNPVGSTVHIRNVRWTPQGR